MGRLSRLYSVDWTGLGSGRERDCVPYYLIWNAMHEAPANTCMHERVYTCMKWEWAGSLVERYYDFTSGWSGS
ncbi:hypothetical protein E5D57_009607 [Metarhizium anisopliae]|nr:hypothetical protein E5D57_009607 [Metarhizium anisopliae]